MTNALTPGLHPERLKHIRASYEASKQGHAFIGHPSYDEQIAIIDALLAGMEQRPVFFVAAEGDDWINAGRIEGKDRPDLGLLPDGINKLYAAPVVSEQAPVVTFFRDGIEAAAKWIDQQRESFDNEHGRVDPDTGTFEFGNNAQLEYSGTLAELAEGIRALHPNTGYSQVMPDFEGVTMTQRECYQAGLEADKTRRVPDSWISAINKLLDNDGSRGCFDMVENNAAHREIEQLLTDLKEHNAPFND